MFVDKLFIDIRKKEKKIHISINVSYMPHEFIVQFVEDKLRNFHFHVLKLFSRFTFSEWWKRGWESDEIIQRYLTLERTSFSFRFDSPFVQIPLSSREGT